MLISKTNLIANLPTIKIILKSKKPIGNFNNKKNGEVDSNYTCFAENGLDSALKKFEKYHSQVFLKKYERVEKHVIREITQDI